MWSTDDHPVGHIAIAAKHPTASKVLFDHTEKYLKESGFFRVSQRRLSEDQIYRGSRSVMQLMRQEQPSGEGVSTILEELRGQRLSSRSTGIWVAYRYFSTQIHGGDPELQRVTEEYLAKSVIPDDINRRIFPHYSNLPGLRHAIDTALRKHPNNRTPNTIAGIACSITESPQEAAEIYSRLVLAAVGFAGIAAEWTWVQMAREEVLNHDPRRFVMEVLRLHGPTWRLTREERDVADSTGRGDVPATTLVHVHSAHRDESVFTAPNEFRPDRWREENLPRQLLSFSGGHRVCPARGAAMDFLTDLYSATARQGVQFRPRRWSIPLPGTLVAPPLGTFILGSPEDAQ